MKKYLIFIVIGILIFVAFKYFESPVLLAECQPFEGAQVCTEQYQPVCAETKETKKTFGNLCQACLKAQEKNLTRISGGECR